MIEEGKTGLFFPTGDAPMLAARLREVFKNDEIAFHLDEQSREAAFIRHNPDTVVQQVFSAYKSILRETSERTSQMKDAN